VGESIVFEDDDLDPPEALRQLREGIYKSWQWTSKRITPNRYHFSLQAVAAAFCLYWYFCPPNAGSALLVLAGVGALMLLSDMKPAHKPVYVAVVIFLIFIEYRAMNKDRIDAQAKYETNMNAILGGDGYLFFLPTFPPHNSSTGELFPVKMIYETTGTLPLMDVNVDLSLISLHGTEVNGRVAYSVMHPAHYNLGQVLPGMFESPFQLEAGNRYYFRIITRRNSFYEKVYIDPNPTVRGEWKISWCVYRYNTSTLLRGNCN
jgi:hypothetical protein